MKPGKVLQSTNVPSKFVIFSLFCILELFGFLCRIICLQAKNLSWDTVRRRRRRRKQTFFDEIMQNVIDYSTLLMQNFFNYPRKFNFEKKTIDNDNVAD